MIPANTARAPAEDTEDASALESEEAIGEPAPARRGPTEWNRHKFFAFLLDKECPRDTCGSSFNVNRLLVEMMSIASLFFVPKASNLSIMARRPIIIVADVLIVYIARFQQH